MKRKFGRWRKTKSGLEAEKQKYFNKIQTQFDDERSSLRKQLDEGVKNTKKTTTKGKKLRNEIKIEKRHTRTQNSYSTALKRERTFFRMKGRDRFGAIKITGQKKKRWKGYTRKRN